MVVLLLAGCPQGPDQPVTTPPPPPPSPPAGFTLSLTTGAPAISPGGSAQLGITVTRMNGFTGAVTVSPQVIGPFEDLSAEPVVVAADQNVATLILYAKSSTLVGTKTWVVSATATGVLDAELKVPILVALPGTFSLTVENENGSPYPHFLATGTVFTLVVDVSRNQFTQPVTLSINSIPGVTIVPSVSPVTGTQTTLTITVSPSAPLGNQTITIIGTSPSVTTATSTATADIRIVTGSYTVAAIAPGAAIPAGGSGTATAVLTRDAGFLTNDATIIVTGTAAAGITIAPTQVNGTQQLTSNTPLPITIAPSVTPGPYVINLAAAALTGVSNSYPIRTTSMTIQVGPPASYTLSVQTAPLSVVAGTSQSDVVLIARSNFTGPITITGVSDAGITVTPSESPTPGNQTTLTVFVPSGVAPGPTHIVTLTGTSTLGPVGTTFAVIARAPVTNTSWSFCAGSGLPVWVAVQDGVGAWTAVSGSNNVYPFTIASARGGIAYVTQPGTTDLHLFYGSQSELQAQGASLCSNSAATKTIGGSLTNFGTAATAFIGLGSGSAQLTLPVQTAFQMGRVPSGALDLVGAIVDGASPQPNAVRMFLRRNVNIPSGGTTGALDFGGSESFVPTIATLTPNVFDQGVAVTYAFQTTNQALATYFANFTNTGPTLSLFGVPAPQLNVGDLHYITAQAYNGTGATTSYRVAGSAVASIANMPITFGAALNPPTIQTLATAPYARVAASLGVQPEYGKLFEATYQQSTGSDRNVFIQVTGAYVGAGTSVTLSIPDFSATAGWSNSWGPLAGFLTHWITTASSWSTTGGITFLQMVNGATFNSATRQGDITP